MRISSLIWLVGLCFTHPVVAAENPFASEFADEKPSLLQGYVQSTLDYLPVQSKLGNVRQRLWLELDKNWSDDDRDGSRLLLDGAVSLDWNPAVGARKDADETSFRIRRLLLAWQQQTARFTIGRQMMLWGSGTALSGGSYFNPVDLDDPFASARAVNFLASDGLRLQYYNGDSELDLIVVPRMPLANLAERNSTWDTVAEPLRPLLDRAEKQHKTGFGGRLSTREQGLDYAIGFFSGIDQGPALQRQGDQLRVVNPRYQSLFLQMSLVAGEGLIRTEYSRDRGRLSDIGDGQPLAGTMDRVMLGWDGFRGGLSLSAEAAMTRDHVRDHESYSGAFSGIYEWRSGDWSAELGAVANFTDRSSMLQMVLTRKYTDQLQLTATGRRFSGADSSEFGKLHPLSTISIGLTWYLE
ncbi:MAG: hypothetical protein OFPII_29020 [Osedax symbiont Rs1]|nr:MAG: hypothetical protein OFPII_29020 [Osedax symbiont Rs1]